LYYLGDFGGAAVYAFFASSKLFLIDAPGGPGLVEFLSDRLQRLGRELVVPTAILLTSCNRITTGGLEELIKKWHPQVVAEPGSFEKLTALCPAGTGFLSAWELPERGWFTVTPISLDGRGEEAIAYQVPWSGKTVLFAGRIPIRINHDAQQLLVADLESPKGDVRSYFTSITRLQKLHPDLWLPTVPVDGQNANLYDKDWERTIEDNLYVVSMILSARQNRR
jgi:hypothetical protein